MVAQNVQKFSNSCLKPVHTLTDDEQVKFVAYFYKQDGPRIQNELRVRDRLIVLLMLDAGLRVGEVVKLTVSDLHVAGSTVGMIFIRPEISKTKTERRVPVTVRLRDSIQEVFLNTWQRWNVQPFTLALQDPSHGRNISARRIQQITKSAGIASIGRPVNPHMLRHTFATRLMNKCSIRTVQLLLGHASLSSTQVYTHPNNQDLQSAINCLNP